MSKLTRRRLLGTTGAAMASGIAGCSGSGNGSGGTTDAGGSGGSGGGGSGDGGGATTSGAGENTTDEPTETPTETSTETPTETPEPAAAGDASMTLGIARFGGVADKFETFVVRFDGFELRPEDGDPMHRDGDGSTYDLTKLSTQEKTELLSTNVRSGDYVEGAFYLPVEHAVKADGSEPSLPYEGVDPATVGLDDFGALTIDSGASTTLTLFCGVKKTFAEDAWTYNMGYSYAGF